MALPSNKILLRSPYWVTKSDTNLSYIMIDLRIWTGELSDEPSSSELPTVRLRSTALNGVASIDIAELARDFVEVGFLGTEESSAVLVSYLTASYYEDGSVSTDSKEYFLGLDGYGTFTDGANYSITSDVLMSTETIRSYDEENNKIPVLSENLTGYKLQEKTNVAGVIQYHTYRAVTGLTAGLSTSDAISYISTSYQGTVADRVVIEFSVGQDKIIDVEYQQCNKYGLTKAFFVNRFGALQQVHFTGRYNISLSSESNDYTRNILEDGNYDVNRHQRSTINKNGKFSIEINTGWIPEEENDTMIEMLMSEQVWIQLESSRLGVGWIPKQDNSYTIPVHMTSKSMDVKNKVNEKLINYSFKFQAANDWINSVR